MKRELLRADREGSYVTILMSDLDNFKNINDSYGHLAGDAVLREVARRMVDSTRHYDAIGRYGGEEFLIILSSCSQSESLNLAERIRNKICIEKVCMPEGLIPVTISLGVAGNDLGERNEAEILIRAADKALYRAKNAGRNRVEVAENEE